MAVLRFSVHDVLALPELAGARLVAGHAGEAQAVRGVQVMAAPEIVHYLRAGHLLLASGYTLAQDPASLAGLVPRLADAALAGLAVKPAAGLETMPGAMRKAADELAFPLIEVPEETPLNDIAAAVLGVVLDHQATRLQRTAEIHERFTDVVLSGGATRDVALTLQRLIDWPVAVLDPAGTLVVAVPRDAAPAKDGGEDAGAGRLEYPIAVGDEHLGMLVVQAGPDGLDDEGVVAVERAAVAIALWQVQARVLAEAYESFIAVSLEELVSGQVTDREALAERAATLGWDLEPPRAVLLAAPETSGAPGEAQLRVLAAAARSALGADAIVWVRSRSVAALVAPPSATPADRQRLTMALQREATARLGDVPVGVGVGAPSVTRWIFPPASATPAWPWRSGTGNRGRGRSGCSRSSGWSGSSPAAHPPIWRRSWPIPSARCWPTTEPRTATSWPR